MASEVGTFDPLIPAHHLPCCRCAQFRYTPALAWCELKRPDFPALCEDYRYGDDAHD
jgi:hypothetical protein